MTLLLPLAPPLAPALAYPALALCPPPAPALPPLACPKVETDDGVPAALVRPRKRNAGKRPTTQYAQNRAHRWPYEALRPSKSRMKSISIIIFIN